MLNPSVSDSRLPHPPPAWSARAVRHTASGLLRSTRPEQWLKNLLVLVAPVAAGQLAAPRALAELTVAFWAFTAAAGGVYLLNDVLDRHDDERHPVKRHRPVASGQVGATTALRAALALLFLPPVLLLVVLGRPALGVVVAAFVAVNGTYTLAGKHRPYIDVLSVAGSLLLRALGGAVAIGIGLDPLLGLVIFAAALHVISSKRFAEFRDIGPAGRTRPVLARYSFTSLTRLRMLSAAAALGAYTAWVLDHASRSAGTWFVVSLLPVVVGFARFDKIVSEGAGERPERLIVRDATLRTSALCAIVALGMAAHTI